MFLKNDIVDSVHIYCGDLNSDNFYSETYRHAKISDITENGITITGGYCQRDYDDYNEEDVEEMYQKWYEVIVDRYIIFRDEHPFRKIKKNSKKNAMEAVRTVIKILMALSF